MPELRYNTAAREWVIIATERAKRPEDFAPKPEDLSAESSAKCPFCPGREDKTPDEIFAIKDEKGWRIRVVPNAFPALSSTGEPTREKSVAGFMKMNGVGKHEVIIESPDHEQVIATMDDKQVEDIYRAYRERYIALSKDPRFEAIILFKNHGRNAGTSLHHPHSQIIATPVVPRFLQDRIEIAEDHYNDLGSCLYCDMAEKEKQEGDRIILETENFVVFEPFASRQPFETWILPKTHSSDFRKISDSGLVELSKTVKTVLGKLYRALKNPSFNYAVYSAPCKSPDTAYFHWSLKIFPRITNLAGFEIGSGMMINTVIPETAAKYLREA